MDKELLVKRLMATFLEEMEEHVAALNRDLLALEKDADPDARAERLKTIFRTAHSLKGAARSVNVEPIEGACHRLEEILAVVRGGLRPLDADLFALLFKTADALEEAGMRLREQRDLGGSPLAALLPRLEAASAGSVPAPRAAPAAPSRPAPPPAPPAAEAIPEPVSAAATVRVSADKLDSLLARSGEMLVARRRVQERAEDVVTLRELVGRWQTEWRTVEKTLDRLWPEVRRPERAGKGERTDRLPRPLARALGQTGGQLRRLEKDLERLVTTLAADGRLLQQAADALDEEVRRVRMLPFTQACQGLDRMAHDLAQAGGKEVDFVIEGGTVELDRSVLEGLKDPLRHLVRNAVDHGTEAAAERQAAGKAARARITVSAVLRGAQVEVTVADDGRGLDLDALRRQLHKRHLPEPADERELARAVFLPGLSTAPLITDVSGRGVGLDVVKDRVESLHGTVSLTFTPGRGTRFTLAVPLTLTTLRALLVSAAEQIYAFAGTNLQKIVRVNPAELRSIEGREMLLCDGTPLPLAALGETLGRNSGPPAANGRPLAVIVAAGEKRMAFVVDECLAEQEIVIKGLGPRVRRVRHFSGATILPSGRIALVLNAANLIRTALGRAPGQTLTATSNKTAPVARKRVLLVEDSVTTRTLMKSILEAAGYDVPVAADGAAAWQLLQERGADIVVSDVDMPHMDGFALTEAVRGSQRFADLPVVLVTARETEPDRVRGVEVGADAYLVKSGFDQKNLLETIAQLL